MPAKALSRLVVIFYLLLTYGLAWMPFKPSVLPPFNPLAFVGKVIVHLFARYLQVVALDVVGA